MEEQWHNLQGDEALQTLGSRHSGLSEAEAEARLLQYGANELKGKKKAPTVLVFLRQFLSPLIYVLIGAVVISLVVQHYTDALVILGVLLLNAIVSFMQESRAEKAMEALVRMAAPKANVRRDSELKQIPARAVVPGDILLLETGDRVPADARLIELSNLKINEATLTGESMPLDKHTEVLGKDVPIAERKNLAFMGTTVSYGRAMAVVVRTGMSSELGKIAGAIREVKAEKPPFRKVLVS